MIFINQTSNEFSVGDTIPAGANWRGVPVEEFNALRAGGWTPTEAVLPWRVSKDTLVSRIPEEVLPAVMAALAQQSPQQQFVFNQSAWFWSTNASLRGLAQALNLDADALMAPDPFLS